MFQLLVMRALKTLCLNNHLIFLALRNIIKLNDINKMMFFKAINTNKAEGNSQEITHKIGGKICSGAIGKIQKNKVVKNKEQELWISDE